MATEELVIARNPRLPPAAYGCFEQPDDDDALRFRFHLCQKAVSLGDVRIDQFWMPIATIYGQGRNRGRNGTALAGYFWASCLLDRMATESNGPGETYLLALLLPNVRSKASRGVFIDSRPKNIGRETLGELDQQLMQSQGHELSAIEFERLAGNLLGRPEYSEEVLREYLAMEHTLLTESVRHLLRNPRSAIDLATSHWAEFMRRIGRRAGHEVQKQALDVLSYECRAAMHRCYSHGWLALLKNWHEVGRIDAATLKFHRLWNLEPLDVEGGVRFPNQHMFHGHVFALHPACSLFIQTASGQRLIGEWIRAIDSDDSDLAFRRMLSGIAIAANFFASTREEARVSRTSYRPRQSSAAATARRGRRPHGRR